MTYMRYYNYGLTAKTNTVYCTNILQSFHQYDPCWTWLMSVCLSRCPNLLSLTLSGCGHITDQDVVALLHSCRRLKSLNLENCFRVTDGVLQAVVAHGASLVEVKVDFCRNVTQAGLQVIRERRPSIKLSAERSAGMIPDSKPDERLQLRRVLQKVLQFS